MTCGWCGATERETVHDERLDLRLCGKCWDRRTAMFERGATAIAPGDLTILDRFAEYRARDGSQPDDSLALPFTPWADLRASSPPEPPWILDGYIARGLITLLAGKPKVGKSTLACAIAEAVDAEALSFVGCEVTGGPVVYLSEEGIATLAPKLPASTCSVALTREAALPKPGWPDLIGTAVAEALRIAAVLLVIDALGF